MGRNNEDFFAEYNRHHVPFNSWDGNGSTTEYSDIRKGASHPDVVHAFTHGHCHGLACQINELAGHPIGKVVYSNPDPDNPNEHGAIHYFNYDKSNPKFGFDIHGRRPVEEIVNSCKNGWGDPMHHEVVSKEDFHKETANEEDWLPIHHEASNTVAKQILGME